ncbi:MAG TPA: RagB/SusD family nutrient uptake outer membrane protein, partial [Chitinophagaceae bacterium]|nr:RagB/SusD family nutrient uptake outer membrane protein [Chitinophagaceae bacterium]
DIFSLDKENNMEIMFAIQNSHATGEGSVLAFFSAPPSSTFATANGQYHYGFTTQFRSLFAADDTLRRDVTLVSSYKDVKGATVTYNAPGVKYGYKDPNGIALGKFQDGTGAPTNINHANDVLVLRYADILLMFAEAENELNGPTTEAYDAINQVRGRAKTSLLSGLDQAGFRDAVRKERLLELSGELTEFFDIQRWGTLQETMENSPEALLAGTAYNAKFYLYPIPQIEIDANTEINQADQNPGW